jgi:hypothetical protein
MAPPIKVAETETERLKLERRRLQYKRNYEKKRVDILKKNRLCHERNEIKVKKGEYIAVVPAVFPTLEALGGHFSGDGCCLSDTKCLGVFTLDRDTAMCYEGLLGGSTKKQAAGYYWRTNASVFHSACEKLIPFSLTKSNQLDNAIKVNRNNDLIRNMKQNDFTDLESSKAMDNQTFDKFFAGFFTADGHCTSRGAGSRAYIVLAQKHPSILHLISSRYDGGSKIKEYNPTANGSKLDRNGNNYKAYQLTYSGDNACAILERIYPYILAERVKKTVKRTIDFHKK